MMASYLTNQNDRSANSPIAAEATTLERHISLIGANRSHWDPGNSDSFQAYFSTYPKYGTRQYGAPNMGPPANHAHETHRLPVILVVSARVTVSTEVGMTM
jgi:hypothetical protein